MLVRPFAPQLARDFEMRLQLANRDKHGMSAAMLAARSGSVAIAAALITEIEETEVTQGDSSSIHSSR